MIPRKTLYCIRNQIVLFSIILLITESNAQEVWDWGWSESQGNLNIMKYFENTIKTEEVEKSIYGRLIWFYKRKVSPVQARRCPFFPSCSTFTLYSMQKYGFFWGLIMGIDRLYYRENPTVFHRIHYHSTTINGEELAYDPPEANFIFGKKDWRVISPDFFNLYYTK